MLEAIKSVLRWIAGFIPWRVKNQISIHFPLLYYLVANLGHGNHPGYWDQQLEKTWDDFVRVWPKKNDAIEGLTESTDRIIDIACGNGSILRFLRDKGYTDLHGLEISQYAIDRLNSEDIDMHYGSLPKIPLENNCFDVVIASQILEHLICRRTFIFEVRRILKTNGRAFLFVPDDCLGPIDELEHTIQYTRDSLYRFLSKIMTVESIESIKDDNHDAPVLFAVLSK